ncbi:hypothetical protein V1515DRAFT_595655 [Lipomyces mesembrius]
MAAEKLCKWMQSIEPLQKFIGQLLYYLVVTKIIGCAIIYCWLYFGRLARSPAACGAIQFSFLGLLISLWARVTAGLLTHLRALMFSR